MEELHEAIVARSIPHEVGEPTSEEYDTWLYNTTRRMFQVPINTSNQEQGRSETGFRTQPAAPPNRLAMRRRRTKGSLST
jgi:hypothetical protein